uniref:RAB6A-GEF complex partner protein 2 n=1 Tax=Ciona intestinalis TaxID=7719 RepID=A0A1W3JNK5_CIOIN|nr:RAB6A-GEF complex partner protein 2 [Ciona intestinalis]|eukprot:XP_009858270.1 RAB6A-GEF complex partner protein 2 [Ciona intestinalis]
MIEVVAKLRRGSVYFAGETIHCSLTFTNVPDTEPGNNTESETIAWASVQLHCFCSISEARVVLPPALMKNMLAKRKDVGPSTSFVPYKDEQGHCVLQTPVKILFCDLKLAPGESKVFKFQEAIPSDTPPTYRGPSCKYSYKLTVGTQRVGAPIKLLRIPVRVLVVYGLTEYQINEDQIPSNPFIEEKKTKGQLLDIATDVLSTITSRRSYKNYKIANSNGLMGVFSLMKTSAKIGEDIVGVFNFADGTVPCLQYMVCLQSEEILAEECQHSPSQGNAIISYAKHIEFCLFANQTHVILPIPLHVTPNFLTELVCLKWRLHFEFVTATSPLKGLDLETGQQRDRMWQGPGKIKTEVTSWDIPVQVLPTMPTQAENVAASHTLPLLRF